MNNTQPIYPFAAIVGQENMKLALILNIINPTLSGVLIRGEKGTAKSTAVRALADILPEIEVFAGDPDSAAMGVNTIEREGISFSHPARFTLVGTMNPEEGELRPQLLDRFGLCVLIEGVREPEDRVAIMEQRAAFDEDPVGFCKKWEAASRELGERIERAIALYPEVAIERSLLFEIASYCLDVGVDGHRGDIIMLKTAKTLAAWHGRKKVVSADAEAAAELVLPHRVRRQPLQEIGEDVKGLRVKK